MLQITLVILALAVVTKLMTTKHINHLRLVQVELQTRVAKIEGDYAQVCEKRKEHEERLVLAKRELAGRREQLAEVREALETQLERNEELE